MTSEYSVGMVRTGWMLLAAVTIGCGVEGKILDPKSPAPTPATNSASFVAGTQPRYFFDGFDGPDLGPGWVLTDPLNTSSYSFSSRPGFLDLITPFAYGRIGWVNPSLRRPVRDTDAVHTLTFAGLDQLDDRQFAGLFLLEPTANHWIALIVRRVSNEQIQIAVSAFGIFVSPITIAMPASMALRIKQTGPIFEFSYQADAADFDTTWKIMGTGNVNGFHATEAGAMSHPWGRAPGPIAHAFFDSFEIAELGTASVRDVYANEETENSLTWTWTPPPVPEPIDFRCTIDDDSFESARPCASPHLTANLTCGERHTLRVWTRFPSGVGSPVAGDGYTRLCGSSKGYNDVAVIVNERSPESIEIARYFAAARDIPDQNLIHVSAPAEEEIDSVAFKDLRSQVEEGLLRQGLTRSINFLVTTKGLPLRIDDHDRPWPSDTIASLESEIGLVLGQFSFRIRQPGPVGPSPYLNSSHRFNSAREGFFLVTRLDGYSTDDVIRMIDRSGPDIEFQPGAMFVLDQDPSWSFLNPALAAAQLDLRRRGFGSFLDTSNEFITEQNAVIGYASWGSNDHTADQFAIHAIPRNTWHPGAIAETFVSSSARTFTFPPAYGQSLIADLLLEGVSGAKGYVYEPFGSAIADVSILFNRYTSGFTLAESFAAASSYLSWMDVIVGDPKTSLRISDPPIPNPDIGAPQLVITSVSNGERVSGEVTLKADASDNVAATQVQWSVDGRVYGRGYVGEPFMITWDTRTYANREHVVSAVARDAAGNVSEPVAVRVFVNNPVNSNTNIALERPVTVSSEEWSNNKKERAVDGSLTTRWSSIHGVDPQWIAVDFGNVYPVRKVIVNWEVWATRYRMQTSTDGATWTDAAVVTNGDGGRDEFEFPLPIEARFVRVFGEQRGTGFGYSIWELEAYPRIGG